MQKIRELEAMYFKLRFDFGEGLICSECVDWAVERLGLDEECEDLEIVLLASARGRDEVLPLMEVIIERYLGVEQLDDQLAAGKYIAALRLEYLEGRETVHSIDMKLTQLFPKLGYPGWLGMLSRNCEYATDVPAFQEPFEQEFSYISRLWADAENREAFEKSYHHKISQQHDV